MSESSATIADPTLLDSGSTGAERLVVYIEDDDGGVRTSVIEVPDGVDVTIGRSRGCSISIESERVSRNHARVRRDDGELFIEDLESRNGTRVNGEVIRERTQLGAGDEIAIRPMIAIVTSSGSIRWRQRQLPSVADLSTRLAAEVDRGRRYRRRFALLMLDLEGSVLAIDRGVERVVERLRRMDFVAEYGPAEIAILLPELDDEAAESAARRLVHAALIPDPERGARDQLAARAGLALFPRHAATPEELISRARAALREARASRRETAMATTEDIPEVGGNVIAVAPATRQLLALLKKVAATPMTVLMIGETGSGKEISAATIHEASNRSAGPFVKLNCACLPPTLLESELFGHEKGAFTGAERKKIGFFEAAAGGTLFLDEIGEIPPAMQAKLLRVLESRTVTRVGGTREIPVDVRVVCATNRDLSTEISEGRFRADLYYRISGFTVMVPPLRDRRADILPLTERFLEVMSAELDVDLPVLTPEARAALSSYGWPGNIRELRNAVERAVVLQEGGLIELDNLPPQISGGHVAAVIAGRAEPGAITNVRDHIAEVERVAIVEALAGTGGNQTQAAKKLGISRRALIYRMEKYGVKSKPRGRD